MWWTVKKKQKHYPQITQIHADLKNREVETRTEEEADYAE